MSTPFDRLVIPKAVAEGIISHALADSPLECCGFLAGGVTERVATARRHFPIRNDLASPTRYRTNARDLLTVARAIRDGGWQELAIYHSHPTSAAIPSKIDLAENTYGLSVAHVIVGLSGNEPEIRAWWLNAKDFVEANFMIQGG